MGVFPWALEGLVAQPEVKTIVSPFTDLLANAFYGGWNEWLSLPAESRSKIGPMHRGGVIHEFAVKRAIAEIVAGNDPAIEICTLGFFKIYIGRVLVLRLKKLTSDGRVPVRGARKQTRYYYANRALTTVRNNHTRLSVGYRLDPTETDVLDVRVLQQIGDQVAWSYAINDAHHPSEFRFPDEATQAAPPPTQVSLIDAPASEAAGG